MESKRLYVEPKRWYAIKRGYKTGIYNDTWSVVRTYVEHYSGAIFKGFDVYQEAYDYMHNGEELLVKKSLYLDNLISNGWKVEEGKNEFNDECYVISNNDYCYWHKKPVNFHEWNGKKTILLQRYKPIRNKETNKWEDTKEEKLYRVKDKKINKFTSYKMDDLIDLLEGKVE